MYVLRVVQCVAGLLDLVCWEGLDCLIWAVVRGEPDCVIGFGGLDCLIWPVRFALVCGGEYGGV